MLSGSSTIIVEVGTLVLQLLSRYDWVTPSRFRVRGKRKRTSGTRRRLQRVRHIVTDWRKSRAADSGHRLTDRDDVSEQKVV